MYLKKCLIFEKKKYLFQKGKKCPKQKIPFSIKIDQRKNLKKVNKTVVTIIHSMKNNY
jgi:hypothetical protein